MKFIAPIAIILSLTVGCIKPSGNDSSRISDERSSLEPTEVAEIKPLIKDLYTADPSAHVFEDKLYLYPSHDYESGIPQDDLGSHFNMKDYHVFSMDSVDGAITNHGVVLSVEDVKWAKKQLWAPDAAEKYGKYYFYFPAKDDQDIFRIGVATSDRPYGPFQAQEQPIAGSFSIDPAIFKDADSTYYMYFGGIWGGQLQRWATGSYLAEDNYPATDEPALSPKVAKLSEDMLSFAEAPRDVQLLHKDGTPITAGENDKRFFEAAWIHTYKDKYYFSYSTGDTHNIAYAIGDNPYGPFTYQGVILPPVLGWTNHHSIVAYNGQWFLFFHDSSLSGGKTHLRSVKVAPLVHNEDGTIQTINAMVDVP